MNSYIGCVGLVAIAAFIIFLALRTRRINREIGDFYQKNSMYLAAAVPQNVLAALGASDPMCVDAKLRTTRGVEIAFNWWQWSTSSMVMAGSTPQSSITSFLAVSFAPNMVSRRFEELAFEAKNGEGSFWLGVKNALGFNTNTPIRVERLDDGTFLIVWQIVRRTVVLESKLKWLRENLSAPPQAPVAPEDRLERFVADDQAVTPENSVRVDSPPESEPGASE